MSIRGMPQYNYVRPGYQAELVPLLWYFKLSPFCRPFVLEPNSQYIMKNLSTFELIGISFTPVMVLTIYCMQNINNVAHNIIDIHVFCFAEKKI